MVTDKALVQAIAKGDPTAFEAFIHQYHKPILGYLERLLNDREKAEDLVQETFLKLLHQIKDRPIPDHVSAWLYRVAANLCRDYWKSAGYRRETPVFDRLPEQKDRQTPAIEVCERRETRREMAKLLNELPDIQREIVILRFYNELKLKEIADVMGCPVGTVKSRLFHALRFLKSRIAEERRVDDGESCRVGCG